MLAKAIIFVVREEPQSFYKTDHRSIADDNECENTVSWPLEQTSGY